MDWGGNQSFAVRIELDLQATAIDLFMYRDELVNRRVLTTIRSAESDMSQIVVFNL
jgi:hypothetical protein